MSSTNNDGIFGWDDAITVERDNQLLDEGPARFTVTDFRRGFTRDGITPQATLTLECEDTHGHTRTIRERFALKSTVLWKITAFFKSVGLLDPNASGQSVKLPWSQVVGTSGYAEVEQTAWQGNDNETHVSNQVKGFLSGAPAKLAASQFNTPPSVSVSNSTVGEFFMDDLLTDGA